MLQMKNERRVHHMASGLLSLAGAAAEPGGWRMPVAALLRRRTLPRETRGRILERPMPAES
jgi:hypothetical protein